MRSKLKMKCNGIRVKCTISVIDLIIDQCWGEGGKSFFFSNLNAFSYGHIVRAGCAERGR